eukprot:752110-Hanusia_phi.AAC.8
MHRTRTGFYWLLIAQPAIDGQQLQQQLNRFIEFCVLEQPCLQRIIYRTKKQAAQAPALRFKAVTLPWFWTKALCATSDSAVGYPQKEWDSLFCDAMLFIFEQSRFCCRRVGEFDLQRRR